MNGHMICTMNAAIFSPARIAKFQYRTDQQNKPAKIRRASSNSQQSQVDNRYVGLVVQEEVVHERTEQIVPDTTDWPLAIHLKNVDQTTCLSWYDIV